MPTDLKIQIFFAVILLMEMLGLFMIVIRTVASLEFAFNRTVAIVDREVQLSRKWREQEKLSREKAVQTESKSKKNERSV